MVRRRLIVCGFGNVGRALAELAASLVLSLFQEYLLTVVR